MDKTRVMIAMMCITIGTIFAGCVSLTYQEKRNLAMLRANGITLDRPAGDFEAPNSSLVAGGLNILPGIGNFYLAFGQGNDTVQCVYGFTNLLLWPISIVWGVPQGAVDAITLNEREMLYYYRYDKYGKSALQEKNITLE